MALLELAAAASLAQNDDEKGEDGGADPAFGYYRKQRTSHTTHQKTVMAKCASPLGPHPPGPASTCPPPTWRAGDVASGRCDVR